jgi:uncharacterized protein YjbJ (UPF0337 family)
MSINVERLQGQWNQLKGEVKKRWGLLTDDDLAWSNGNIDHLVGRIQQRTGETRSAVEQYLDQLTAQGGSRVSTAVESVGSYAHDLSHRFRDHYGQISEEAHEGYLTVRDHVCRNPIRWLSVALGVGVLTGLLARGGLGGSRRHRLF